MIKAGIRVFRDWFIERTQKPLPKTVAGSISPYDEKTIEIGSLKQKRRTKRSVWVSLSEDEHRDQKLKK